MVDSLLRSKCTPMVLLHYQHLPCHRAISFLVSLRQISTWVCPIVVETSCDAASSAGVEADSNTISSGSSFRYSHLDLNQDNTHTAKAHQIVSSLSCSSGKQLYNGASSLQSNFSHPHIGYQQQLVSSRPWALCASQSAVLCASHSFTQHYRATSGLSNSSGAGQTTITDTDSQQARGITRLIRTAADLQQLQEILHQQGTNFNAIHAAAAFGKAAKLAHSVCPKAAVDSGEEAAVALLASLAHIWNKVIQQATPRELANVLHACTKLDYRDAHLCSNTTAAFLEHKRLHYANAQDLSTAAYAVAIIAAHEDTIFPAHAVLEAIIQRFTAILNLSTDNHAISGQSIANVLWASTKVACPVAETDVDAFLRALAQPTVLTTADAQSLATSVWAVSQLYQQEARSPVQLQLQPAKQKHSSAKQQRHAQEGQSHVLEQLLSAQQLAKIAQGSPQAVSTTLLALARLSTGAWHRLTVPFAQQCAEQLLKGNTARNLTNWNAQDIGSGLWACAKLGVKGHHGFFKHAAEAANLWLPDTIAPVLIQVAWACTKAKHKDQQFMESILQRGRFLMHRNHGQVPLLPNQAERTALTATLSWAVAMLNMTQLAGDVKALISASGIKQQEEPLTPADARALWRVHGWLQHEQFLGNHGLTRLLTAQQLMTCAEASRHTHRRSPPHGQTRLQLQLQEQQTSVT